MSQQDTREIQEAVSHRPWPLPRMPWVLFQSWQRLLFAHWALPPDVLRPLVPPQLEIDIHGGTAWVGITPFRLAGFRARMLPPVPGLSDFPELNVRTYVRYGGKPGIHFFSLDAGSRAAVIGARAGFRLPYHEADMEIREEGENIRYHSQRKDDDAAFDGSYRPTGPTFTADPGSLEYFLTERYALYSVLRNGSVLRGNIHHKPWMLQTAEADIRRNTMAATSGIMLPDEPPLLHYAHRQDTLIWTPMPADDR